MDLARGMEAPIQQLEPGGRVTAAQELRGGVSARVWRVDISTADGEIRRVVLRQHGSAEFKNHSPQVAAKEFGVLTALRGLGFPVPEPYLLDDSETATAPFLVMEFIEGSTDVSAADLPSALEQMAVFLTRLHDLEPRAVRVPDLAELADPLKRLSLCLPTTEVGRLVREALLADELVLHPNPSVLIHGDFWPGNIMWRDGQLVAVLDWEDTCITDPLVDLACARVELLCQYGPDATESFTQCYLNRSASLNRNLCTDSLPLWDVFVSATALASMELWGLDPADEKRRRLHTEAFFNRAAGALLPNPPAHLVS